MTAPALTDFIDPAVRDRVTGFLATVETELRVAVASPDPLIDEVAAHLARAGGKRFRPLTVGLCAQLGDPSRPELLPAAVLMELTHLATLYHDDVMDEAPLRRGAPSANARWSNPIAVYVGDFLLARA